MKQKILIPCSVVLIFLFIAASCEKEDEAPQLPPITQTGEGTLGCLIDGKVFEAEPIFMRFPISASNNVWEDKRWIISGSNGTRSMVIQICKDDITISDGISLNGSELENCSNGSSYYKEYLSENATFSTSSNQTGEVFISRFDTINSIISGTFYFDAINSNGKVIEVRDGRFDVKIIN